MAVTSSVNICNSALAKIGAGRIVSLDEESRESQICNEQYNKVREALLSSHPWNFAIKRVELADSGVEPEFGLDYQFQLPPDCLRVLETDLEEDAPTWKVEGRFILANSSELKIRYIRNETDVSKYSPHFYEALASALAADICYSLVQSTSLRESLMKEAEIKLRLARSFDAQEGGGDRTYARSWLNSRA